MRKIFTEYHKKWAIEKIRFFLLHMHLPDNASVLDLGGGNGAYMERFKRYFSKNNRIIIADLNERALQQARNKGFETKGMDGGTNRFPFADKEFDCIFCNSVIEHVTVPKNEVWKTDNDFKKRSLLIQKKFADEIRRCAKSYYVQTPHRHFPVEAHTWFPMINFLPRNLQVRSVKFLNKFWFKKTRPDWNLLDEKQMKEFFPDAAIHVIRKLGFKKEIIAMRSFAQKA